MSSRLFTNSPIKHSKTRSTLLSILIALSIVIIVSTGFMDSPVGVVVAYGSLSLLGICVLVGLVIMLANKSPKRDSTPSTSTSSNSHPITQQEDNKINSEEVKIEIEGIIKDGSQLNRIDPMFPDAARFVVAHPNIKSVADLQRSFEIGYNRAFKIMDQLVAAGIIDNINPTECKVLIQDSKMLEDLLVYIYDHFVRESINRSTSYYSIEKTDKVSTSTKVSRKKPKLDSLIGLETVKQEIKTLTNFIQIQQKRREQGLKESPVSYHCVFTGSPGTGKTTVARIVADIYKKLGILQKGHLVETDRAGLVAEYVGQTAVKTNKIIDSALDGVLFIDEAYSLIQGGQNDFGKEAIATLLKRMEDDRDRLVVILAGYTKEMQDFIDTNPGLQSRFNRYIEFPDYSADELMQIFEKQVAEYDYILSEDAKPILVKFFTEAVAHKDQNFGNARFVRNIFEKTLEKQANRLSLDNDLTKDELKTIESEDLPNT